MRFSPLVGHRIVDATEDVAGGCASRLPADLGAEVAEVAREGVDSLRRWSAAHPDADVPAPRVGTLGSVCVPARRSRPRARQRHGERRGCGCRRPAGRAGARPGATRTDASLPLCRHDRSFSHVLHHPVAGQVALPGVGLRSPQFDTTYRAPTPTVGQHTVPVPAELFGLDREDLDTLAPDGLPGGAGAGRPA